MQPVIRIAVQVHDGEDAEVIGAILEQDAVGKRGGEVAADLAPQRPIQARMGTLPQSSVRSRRKNARPTQG